MRDLTKIASRVAARVSAGMSGLKIEIHDDDNQLVYEMNFSPEAGKEDEEIQKILNEIQGLLADYLEMSA